MDILEEYHRSEMSRLYLIQKYLMPTGLIPGDVNLDHLEKLMSARFVHHKLNHLHFAYPIHLNNKSSPYSKDWKLSAISWRVDLVTRRAT